MLGTQSRMGGANHALRALERSALEAMIQQAVPLSPQGQPLDGAPVLPHSPVGGGMMPGNRMAGTGGLSPSSSPSSHSVVTVWRIIVFDDVGRDIIAPLMKVVDLRELGVTLYMHIDMERDPVQGAPVIYFCAPTLSNLEKIARDCGNCLYEWFYLNFTAELPRNLLEQFGEMLSRTSLQTLSHIRVFDRTLHYVALSDDLFSLMLNDSFAVLNSGSDEVIEAHVTEIVRGVSHVLISMQLLPVIVHSKTGAAEEIARRVAVRLSDALQDGQLVPAPTAIFGRPLLLLVDRSHDIASALHHPFTYRGLLSDAAAMKLNVARVKLANGKEEQLEVDPERDWFYRDHAALDFGEIGGCLENARRRLQEEQAALAKTADPSLGLNGSSGSDADTMSQLVANAPVIAEKKRILDSHTKTAFGLLEVIRSRKLDVFSGVERELLQHAELDKGMFSELLTSGGTVQDRQRLYLIAYLMCKENKETERYVQQQLPLLSEHPFPALDYFKHLEKWSIAGPSQQGKASQHSNSTAEGFGWGVAQLLAENFAATLGGTVEERELPLTKMVAALLQDPQLSTDGGGGSGGAVMGSPSSRTGGGTSQVRSQVLQNLSAYDVRSKKPVDLQQMYFSQAVVFSIGGGSIAEYDDLKRWESNQPKKSVLYGCTSVSTGDTLLSQLSALGEKLGPFLKK